MTELENKALRHSLELLKDFSYGNIYSGLDELLKNLVLLNNKVGIVLEIILVYFQVEKPEKVMALKNGLTP